MNIVVGGILNELCKIKAQDDINSRQSAGMMEQFT